MNISLLADCPQEAVQLAKWYWQEWACHNPDNRLENIIEKVALGIHRDALPMAFVVHLDGQSVAAAELKFRELDEYPANLYWLDGVYVTPAHRGKGIATQLIDYAISKACELKLPHLSLRCEAHNVKLYQARGFKVIKQEQNKFIMAQQLEFKSDVA